MTESECEISLAAGRGRANSAPPASLHYALLAHTSPLEGRADQRSPSSASKGAAAQSPHRTTPMNEIVTHRLYCEAACSLDNPRDPRPFGAWLFPSTVASPPTSTDGEDVADVVGGDIRPKLTVDEARLFLDLLDKRSHGESSSGMDPRSAVAQKAFATIRQSVAAAAAAAASQLTSSHHSVEQHAQGRYAAQAEQETLHFYKRKYLDGVDQLARLEAELQTERSLLKEHRDRASRVPELEQKLLMAERHMSMLKENCERAVKSCSMLEEENKTLRRELLESSEHTEKFKEMAQRHKLQLNSQLNLNKDLQGQLDLYRGNTSVPLFAGHPDVQLLRSEKDTLEEKNTKMMNRLAEVTKQFATEKKRLEHELAEARQALERAQASSS